MRRREFVGLLGGATAWPLVGHAQQPGRMRRIGVLFPLGENDPEQMARRAGLQQSLEQLGWTNGRNVRIEYRYAVGGPDRFDPLAKELVALAPDVIFAQTPGAAAAVQRQTRSIPIVFANVSDPIGAGFVDSLARPGHN